MKKLISIFLVSSALMTQAVLAGDHHEEKVEIKSFKAADNIYMIEGKGGNIGVLKGVDDTIIIDNQFAELSADLKNEIAKISDKPIEFLINTHFHFDHTGGNENFVHDGAHIIAQENVRETLKKGTEIKALNKVMEPAPEAALPFITYKSGLSLHEGRENVELVHYPAAHTDGDTAVFFKTSNVIHTGDIYFSGLYPFVDTSNGGTVQGMIDAMTDIIAKADDKTKIIPGHGPLSDKKQMQKDLAMLKDFYQTVMVAKNAGKTKEEILKMDAIQKYDAEYGQVFLSSEKFVGIVFGG